MSDKIIYKLTNLINGKIYIGQTSRPLQVRMAEHCRNTGCYKLFRAIKKYGIENFSKEILDTCDSQQELNLMESWFIFIFNSTNKNFGYNAKTNSCLSDEMKQKISDTLKSKKLKVWLGKHHSDETKDKLRKIKLGTTAVSLEIALEIIDFYKLNKITHRQLSEKYNISVRTIFDILNQKAAYSYLKGYVDK